MRNVLLLALVLTCLVPAGANAVESAWTTGWKNSAAKATGDRPILANFTGSDWCGWCMKLDREVFATPEFAAWAKRSVVLMEVDFPRAKPLSSEQQRENQALAEKFNVEGFPTIMILTQDGREIGRLGYQAGGAKAWIAAAERIIAKGPAPQ